MVEGADSDDGSVFERRFLVRVHYGDGSDKIAFCGEASGDKLVLEARNSSRSNRCYFCNREMGCGYLGEHEGNVFAKFIGDKAVFVFPGIGLQEAACSGAKRLVSHCAASFQMGPIGQSKPYAPSAFHTSYILPLRCITAVMVLSFSDITIQRCMRHVR